MTEEKQFKKYRKIPVIIEAYQTNEELGIETLEGTMKANPGDWIIRGVKGELYPCKPDVFKRTYEKVDSRKKRFIEMLNGIYEDEGFYGVINEIADRLTYGTVKQVGNRLICITTAGYSDDEYLLHCLTYITSVFGYRHYVGQLRGGAYYFAFDRDATFKIQRVDSE